MSTEPQVATWPSSDYQVLTQVEEVAPNLMHTTERIKVNRHDLRDWMIESIVILLRHGAVRISSELKNKNCLVKSRVLSFLTAALNDVLDQFSEEASPN